jgi:hypothetical protein
VKTKIVPTARNGIGNLRVVVVVVGRGDVFGGIVGQMIELRGCLGGEGLASMGSEDVDVVLEGFGWYFFGLAIVMLNGRAELGCLRWNVLQILDMAGGKPYGAIPEHP